MGHIVDHHFAKIACLILFVAINDDTHAFIFLFPNVPCPINMRLCRIRICVQYDFAKKKNLIITIIICSMCVFNSR